MAFYFWASPKKLFINGELYIREGKLRPEERRQLPNHETFMVGQKRVDIYRGLCSTTIHEQNPPRKIRVPGWGEEYIEDFNGATVIQTQTTPEEDEEIFNILDEQSKRDLENSYRLR